VTGYAARMKLFHRKYGKGGTPLIIVHGLYGSGDNWVTIARELADRFEVYVVDQRNHGRSPHSATHDYPSMRDDLKKFMDAEGIEQAVMVGHSMGAKTVMFFAASWPDRVQSLVSVDMAPRAYHQAALESRSVADHGKMINALMELDLASFGSREEMDGALAPGIGSERVRSFLLKNVRRDRNGVFSWRINLEALHNNLDKILDGLSTDGQNPDGSGVGGLGLQKVGTGGLDLNGIIARGGIKGFPALFIAGGNSDYIRPEDHRLIREVFPGAQVVTIPNAGHWLHAEQPRLLLKTLNYFLDS